MVLVSHEHEFVFLKTRKTAGTSVEMLLEPYCAPDNHIVTEKTPCIVSPKGVVGSRLIPEKRTDRFDPFRRKWRNHMPAAKVKKYLGRSRWDRYRKVTTVRDPFDRMVSFFHFRYHHSPILRGDFSDLRKAFQDYVTSQEWDDDTEIVTVSDDVIIDRVVRYERLREDLLEVGRDLGLRLQPDTLPLTKSTASTRKSYAVPDYYDARSVEVVRRRLWWLFDHFGYPTTPWPDR
jgi:hypothetical protein